MNGAAKPGAVVKRERERFGIFDAVNANGCVGAREKRPKIADPPIFDGELKNILFAGRGVFRLLKLCILH